MPEYFYNNNPVPESQLLRLSEENDMSIEDFMEEFGVTTSAGEDIWGPGVTSSSETQQEIDHISQEDFIDISSKGFGMFGKGREELMSEKLYDTYNPERDPNKIQFTEFGAGNEIRVTLPNGDEEEFDLAGAGTFGVETAQMKKDHIRLMEFIGQEKRKEVSPEFKTKFEETLFNREEKVLFSDLDGNVAKDLNLLDLKDENGNSYEFEADKMFSNAIKVTLPNGSKKTFNITSLASDLEHGDKTKKEILNSIFRYIESNPLNYTKTADYNQALKGVE